MDTEKPVAKSTIVCSYVLAFIMPLAGFFAGIYLMTKRQSGHGVTCLALSVVVGLLIVAAISSIN